MEREKLIATVTAAQNGDSDALNVGDQVTIDHAVPAEGSESAILDGYTLTIVKRALSPVVTEPVHISELQDSADTIFAPTSGEELGVIGSADGSAAILTAP